MPIKFDTTTRTPLTEGGEGYIYEHNGKIIKTFKSHIDIVAKERKVNALMKATLPKAVITPVDTVLDMRVDLSATAWKRSEERNLSGYRTENL